MSKKVLARVLSLSVAAMLVMSLALLCSCNTQKPITNDVPIELPLEEERTITYWTVFDNTSCPTYSSYADHPFFQRLKAKTNINIEFVSPTDLTIGGSRGEWINLIASGETTDMVSHNWFVPDLEGSTIDSAADEELYYELTEFVDVQMPNFNKLREEYAVIDKLMITPYGNIMYIPKLTGVQDMNMGTPVTDGLIVRQDFLDELQMEVPTTVDEWHTMLNAFKNTLGVANPFWLGKMDLAPGCTGDAFISCYNQAYEHYIGDDNLVHYGVIEDGTLKYVTMMAQWYDEGLVSTGSDITRADKLSDNVGAWGASVNDIVSLTKSEAVNPNYELVAAPYPVLNEGDEINVRASYMPIGNKEINCIYICQSYDSPALAAKWIDQLFSEESYMEASYGVENEDYTVDAEGNITFTTNITEGKILNADGTESVSYLYGVAQRLYLGSMWADRDVLIKMLYTAEAQAAIDIWSQAKSTKNIIRSTSMQFTVEESEQLSELNGFWMAQTGTLRGMIHDSELISEWDNFVAQMNDMGMEEYVSLYQKAWDRYLAS